MSLFCTKCIIVIAPLPHRISLFFFFLLGSQVMIFFFFLERIVLLGIFNSKKLYFISIQSYNFYMTEEHYFYFIFIILYLLYTTNKNLRMFANNNINKCATSHQQTLFNKLLECFYFNTSNKYFALNAFWFIFLLKELFTKTYMSIINRNSFYCY